MSRKIKQTLLWKVIWGFLRPRQVRLPMLVWGLLIASISLLIWRYQAPLPPTTAPPNLVILTPTPGASPTPGPSPTPVGSGGTVAFSMRHNGNSDIYLLSQNNGKMLRLTYDPAEDREPAWSPDGRWLAFASHRADNWDLYLMELDSGVIVRLTRDPIFEANPTWSPDSRWLAYEAYQDGNLDLHVISAEGEENYQLTSDPAPDYSPAWSPDGRHIVFTSLRDGNQDLYAISLDGGTVTNLTNTPDQAEDHPAWQHNGNYLAYSTGVPGEGNVYLLPFAKEAMATGELRPLLFGIGAEPTWSPDNQALVFVFHRGTQSYLVAADTTGWALTQEGYQSTAWISGPAWSARTLPATLVEQLAARANREEQPLYTELLLDKDSSLSPLVGLPNVNGGDGVEKLSDKVNDSFNALHQRITAETGWDYLDILGDSSRPMIYTPRPGQGRISWHVCGRAVDINQGFLRNGRIEMVREDISGVTYWRLFIKAEQQDGSLGEPLRRLPWDLSARAEGGAATTQGGKLKAQPPAGYYVDFTTLAADYGWERRNALSNWRNSWFDIEWWHFQKTEGLSWYECMLERYTPEEIEGSYGELPWWTKLPENEVQFLPW
ncbi:MAG: DPP IV N-terminal domain-containing protein [Chloroflexota bacterium]|nr:DPP IV N-terminal domain-containing protein [Chloroflexota bacterium]